jgi:hypothetical protein
MQSNNFTQDLKDRGLGAPNSLNRIWEFNPSVGGPIQRDKLWFHWTMRHAGAYTNGPMLYNKNAGDPAKWTYEPDTSRPPYGDRNTNFNFTNLRLTWQATPKNEFGFVYDPSKMCDCPRGVNATTAPEANENSEVAAHLDNPSRLFCHVTGTFHTQVKLTGSYTVPRIDLQPTAVVQNLPGPAILANYVASLAEVQPSLGRPLAGGERNVTVSIVEPRTMYGERRNQIDLRIGKILRFGRTIATPTFDLYNALNANPVLDLSSAFATWQRPEEILTARFAKIGLQVTF